MKQKSINLFCNCLQMRYKFALPPPQPWMIHSLVGKEEISASSTKIQFSKVFGIDTFKLSHHKRWIYSGKYNINAFFGYT